jgi:hypothetical protein
MGSIQKQAKAKLPRKRKKKAIKAQGRKWYYDTIKLFGITQKLGKFHESVCKFWVNESITFTPDINSGRPYMVPTPERFW